MTTASRSGPLIVGIIYLLSALSMGTVGVIVPARALYAAALGTSPAAIGVAISLFSLPSALLAAVGGSVIDRFGLKQALVVSTAIAIVGDLLAFAAPSILVFDMGLTLIGIGYAGIAVGAPAFLMASLEGTTRIRGMSFWSSYAPVGFSFGLLIAAAFVDGSLWRTAMLVHLALMAAAGLMLALLLPAPARPPVLGTAASAHPLGGMIATLREGPVLRLGIAVALPNMISYGTSLIAPSYLASANGVSVAASATTVAVAKIVAMLVGGTVVGHLLARRINSGQLFVGVAVMGCLAQALIYLPGTGLAFATAALIVWLFAFACIAAVAMTMLPVVVTDPARAGAASGVVNQCISLASLIAPTVYFGLSGWMGFVALAWAGLIVSVALLPGRSRTARNTAATAQVAV